MKNKSLRLVLVVVLVIAMVLSMAACEKKEVPVVTPTPPVVTPKPVVTPTPTAPVVTPTPTAPVGDVEAALAAKYGITFPALAKDAKDKNVYGSALSFEIKGDAANLNYLAYANQKSTDGNFTITASVKGVNFEGKTISSETIKSIVSDLEYKGKGVAAFTATEAGIYTVTYKVTVNAGTKDYAGDLAQMPAIKDSYTVVKTYTIEKAEKEIKVNDDAFTVEDTIKFTPVTGLGSVPNFTFFVDTVTVDNTKVGAYPLTITAKDAKGNKVDRSTIVVSNYTLKFVDGTRYITNKEDLAKVIAAYGSFLAIDALAPVDINKEKVAIARGRYEELTAAQKALFNVSALTGSNTGVGADLITNLVAAEYDVTRYNLVDEAKDMIKKYKALVTNTVEKTNQGNEIIAWFLALNTKEPVVGERYGSDLQFVVRTVGNDVEFNTVAKDDKIDDIIEIVVDDKGVAAIKEGEGLVGKYLTKLIGNYKTEKDKVEEVKFDNYKTVKTQIEKVKTAYAALTASQKDVAETEESYNAVIAKLDAITRCEQYNTLINTYNLNGYKDVEKATKAVLEAIIGFDFETGKPTSAGAAEDLFGSTRIPTAYVGTAMEVYTKFVKMVVDTEAALVAAKAAIPNFVLSTYGADGYAIYRLGSNDTTVSKTPGTIEAQYNKLFDDLAAANLFVTSDADGSYVSVIKKGTYETELAKRIAAVDKNIKTLMKTNLVRVTPEEFTVAYTAADNSKAAFAAENTKVEYYIQATEAPAPIDTTAATGTAATAEIILAANSTLWVRTKAVGTIGTDGYQPMSAWVKVTPDAFVALN